MRVSADVIYEDDAMRISGVRGGTRALVVAFTGIGHGMGGLQQDEFLGSARGGGDNSVIFVRDKLRSWYNEPSIGEKLAEIVREFRGACEKTVAIGNSMGGFGAIVLSGRIGAGVAIAFAPQVSVSPRVVPEESRWRRFTKNIRSFTYEDANDFFDPRCRYFLIQGAVGKEWPHLRKFKLAPNVHQYVLDGAKHNTASLLKRSGDLSAVVQACVDLDLAALNDILVAKNGAILRAPDNDPYSGPRPPVAAEAPPRQDGERERRKAVRKSKRRRSRAEAEAAAGLAASAGSG